MSKSSRTTSADVLHIRFNQNSTCFSCASSDGIRVFNVEPFKQKLFLDVGRVTFVEMLYRSNLIAYVPADHVTGLPSNVVNVYDDQKKMHVLELAFSSSVIALRMTRTKLLVVLMNKILIFSFPNACRLLHTFETKANPRGLCEICNNDGALLAFPFKTKSRAGVVHLIDSLQNIENDSSVNPRVIQAHSNELVAMAMNDSGSLLATSSTQGTLIRVFSTRSTCEKLFEFRRGSDSASIHSLAFSGDSNFICASSSTGTVHIYAVRDLKRNRLLPFQNPFSEASGDFANFKLVTDSVYICAFSTPQNVVVTCFNGTFHKYVFDADGRCNREIFDLFLDGLDGVDF